MIEGSEALHAVQRLLAEASHAPGFLYASPEVYRREVEGLFMRDWHYVARVEELHTPATT
jgi:phenylpropionate dioxygenase-like ring-hydroxylating dioxygenase large terminal subunit